MQVIEIKNDLVQVRYNAEEQALSLGDFFVVSDNNSDILTQIVHLETDEDTALCLGKFILNINSDSSTSLYNGYMPSLDAVVSPVTKQEIIDFISPVSEGINAGTLINSNLPVMISESILDTPLYIQSDYSPAVAKLVNHILSSNNIENNVLLYDIDGIFCDYEMPVLELGKDFKIPLNTLFIDFIYNNDLEELNIKEKALVQDILLEIKDYISTADKDYIEFSTLLDVVNTQYEENPSDALILFRNKLIEYKQLGYFADSKEETDTFYKALNGNLIISAFKLSKQWQKVLLEFCVNSIKQKTHLIAQISDTSVEETTINTILTSKHIVPVFISNYAFKLRNVLRSKIPNMIFFQAIDDLNDFPLYSNFLNLLFDNTYIIWGEITSFLSIIASYEKPEQIINKDILSSTNQTAANDDSTEQNDTETLYDMNEESDLKDNDIVLSEENILDELAQTSEEKSIENDIETNISENVSDVEFKEEKTDDIKDFKITDENDELQDDTSEETIEEPVINENETVNTNDESSDVYDEIFQNQPEEQQIEIIEQASNEEETSQIQEDIDDDDLDFLQEEENSEDSESENIVFEQENEEQFTISSDENGEIIDEPYYTDENEQNESITEDNQEEIIDEYIEPQEQNISEEPNEEEYTENSNDEEYTEQAEESIEENTEEDTYEEIEEPKFSIPVYESTPSVEQDNAGLSPSFAEGNIVYHEKYGKGIIEKVISYGSKTLCSIQFDNIGRRLLDPNLADLKQI